MASAAAPEFPPSRRIADIPGHPKNGRFRKTPPFGHRCGFDDARDLRQLPLETAVLISGVRDEL
jgi:hypothetical protein